MAGILHPINPSESQQKIKKYFHPLPQQPPPPPQQAPQPQPAPPSQPHSPLQLSFLERLALGQETMDSSTPPSQGESVASGAASGSSFMSSLAADTIILTIGTGNSSIKVNVHRDVLGEKSPVLLLLLNPKDGTKPTELDLSSETPAIFGHLLEFIYKGKVMAKGEPMIKVEEVTEANLARAALASSPLLSGANKRTATVALKTLSGENSAITKFKVLLLPYAKQAPRDAETWASQIENDIDFGTIKQKLKDEAYADIAEIDKDFDLLYTNHVQVHGPTHHYTKLAYELKGTFHQKTAEMRKGTVSDKNLPGMIPNPPTQLQQQQTKMAQLRIPLPSDELLALHILATKYQVTGLQDLSMTSLISSHIQSCSFATLSEIITSFNAVSPNTPSDATSLRPSASTYSPRKINPTISPTLSPVPRISTNWLPRTRSWARRSSSHCGVGMVARSLIHVLVASASSMSMVDRNIAAWAELMVGSVVGRRMTRRDSGMVDMERVFKCPRIYEDIEN
ncbi:hypothetical protein BDZ45DRAFT_673278 [Acephala macrosclerotiorum]|nr:hypothetical protein BDZ45DRAFT_673278 [Acephala macrosclerotiorum]